MATIKLKHLEPGVTLSADVKDANGRMLLNSGATVTEKHLKIFKTWGVTEVSILGEGPEEFDAELELADIDPELLQKITQQIDELFVHCDQNHPVYNELITHIKINLAKKQLSSEKV